MKRRRVYLYACAALAVIALGMASRRIPGLFPAVLGKYPGDALWALMAFACWGVVLPSTATWRVAAVALIMCYVVEFSQLYQAPWINAIRATTLGHLVLGSAFHWIDLVAYPVGVSVGVLAERVFNWVPDISRDQAAT